MPIREIFSLGESLVPGETLALANVRLKLHRTKELLLNFMKQTLVPKTFRELHCEKKIEELKQPTGSWKRVSESKYTQNTNLIFEKKVNFGTSKKNIDALKAL